jgi:hypothetical protein
VQTELDCVTICDDGFCVCVHSCEDGT